MATPTASQRAKSKSAATKRPAKKSTRKRKSSAKKWSSRAVTRLVEAGSAVECKYCAERIKFRAKIRQYQVICNVYIKGTWDRVEHFHQECYEKADQPYGTPSD